MVTSTNMPAAVKGMTARNGQNSGPPHRLTSDDQGRDRHRATKSRWPDAASCAAGRTPAHSRRSAGPRPAHWPNGWPENHAISGATAQAAVVTVATAGNSRPQPAPTLAGHALLERAAHGAGAPGCRRTRSAPAIQPTVAQQADGPAGDDQIAQILGLQDRASGPGRPRRRCPVDCRAPCRCPSDPTIAFPAPCNSPEPDARCKLLRRSER